ncbi:MAG: hypothetical protein M1594_01220 [Candidatus Marsarchaeota archaeon]|nr:hypothetical protein [Candidatus Marsarchaeota archaeon]
MSIQGSLLKAYFTLEDKYYGLMDFFEKIKIPVYEFFVHPIENRRIPSFPVFLIILIIILLAFGLVFRSPVQKFDLTLSISGPSTAQVSVFQGAVSLTKTVSEGSFNVFTVSKGLVLIKVSSAGFAENITDLNVEGDAALTVTLQPLPSPKSNASIPSFSGIQIP